MAGSGANVANAQGQRSPATRLLNLKTLSRGMAKINEPILIMSSQCPQNHT
jgi:hypothetical protein